MTKRIGYRIFLVSGDEVSPLSKSAFDEFCFGRQAVLRAFAGKTVDIATVVCRLENAKLKEIVRIYCQRFKVKDDGSIDEGTTHKPSRSPATLRNSAHYPGATAAAVNEKRLARTLTMMSGAAQKKILDVLWR